MQFAIALGRSFELIYDGELLMRVGREEVHLSVGRQKFTDEHACGLFGRAMRGISSVLVIGRWHSHARTLALFNRWVIDYTRTSGAHAGDLVDVAGWSEVAA